MTRAFLTALALSAAMGLPLSAPLSAETLTLAPQVVPLWKPVYGEVEPRDLIPARARIGGTITELSVTEGDEVAEGAEIGRVVDEKLAFQLEGLDAQLAGLQRQLDTARTELERGVSLRERGVITQANLDQLQTAVDVLDNQIRSVEAQKLGIDQQVTEGAVLSPVSGVILSVPVARGSVIGGGETVAQVAGGGVFLRIALPERHAGGLDLGADIQVGHAGEETTGTIVKVYPEVSGGRVLVDVEVQGLDDRFIGRRVPVRLPVGQREALMVPLGMVERRAGLDFVTVAGEGDHGAYERIVVPGETYMVDGEPHVEILSGLVAGDVVVSDHE